MRNELTHYFFCPFFQVELDLPHSDPSWGWNSHAVEHVHHCQGGESHTLIFLRVNTAWQLIYLFTNLTNYFQGRHFLLKQMLIVSENVLRFNQRDL